MLAHSPVVKSQLQSINFLRLLARYEQPFLFRCNFVWIARVEVVKVAQLIVLSPKCGTNYTLCCGLACVQVETVKIVP